jgi:proline iminopeptidase
MKNQNFKSTWASMILVFVIVMTVSGCQEPELEPAKPGLLVPLTVDQDPSLPQLSINGTLFHTETFGDPGDPMIVVLHGGPGGDYRSMLQCKTFADHGYFVVFYDQRGSGLSQRHRPNSFSLDVMIEDLRAIIQYHRQPEQKTFLLGLSWGAMLATAYIDRYPDNVSGAILAEPGGFTWKDTKDYISRTRNGKVTSEEVSDTFYPDQFLTGKEDQYAILDYKFALKTAHDNAKGNALGNPGPSPFWRYGTTVNYRLIEIAEDDPFDFTRSLDLFTTRVLFLYSELNRAYGLSHAQHVSSAYPNVELTDQRHWPRDDLFRME